MSNPITAAAQSISAMFDRLLARFIGAPRSTAQAEWHAGDSLTDQAFAIGDGHVAQHLPHANHSPRSAGTDQTHRPETVADALGKLASLPAGQRSRVAHELRQRMNIG